MNRGIQIVLLVLLFFVCGAVGYVGGGMLNSNEPQPVPTVDQTKVVVVEEPVVEVVEEPEVKPSTKPEITNIPAPKKNSDNKTYSLVVEATVESGDKLVYYITPDDGRNNVIVAESENGIFDKLSHSSNGKYLVWVKNIITAETSYCLVAGFTEIKVTPSIKPLTKEELNQSLSSTTDGSVPAHISSRFGAKHKVVNAANGSIVSNDFNSLWTDMFMGVAKYKVTKVVVDQSTNLLVEIHVNVI